jgi:hypothetical protein
MRSLFLLLVSTLAFIFIKTPAYSKAFKLHSYKLPMVLSRVDGVLPFGRGENLPEDSRVVLGYGGIATWDLDSYTTFSLVGPAELWNYQGSASQTVLQLQYGEFLIRGSDSLKDFVLEVGTERFELSKSTEYFVVKKPAVEAFVLQNLQTREECFYSSGTKTCTLISAESVKSSKEKFFVLRQFREDNSANSQDRVAAADSLTRFLEGTLHVGFTRLKPTAGSSFLQNLGGMSASLKRGKVSFINFPLDPSKITRNHYLYWAGIRYGWGLHYYSYWIEPSLNYKIKSQNLAAFAFYGWGWEGISLDLFAGPVLDLNRVLKNGHRLRWPAVAGFDAQYRIDAAKLFDAEMGLVFGVKYFLHFYQRNSAVQNTSATAVTPQNFYTETFSFQAGLNMRF